MKNIKLNKFVYLLLILLNGCDNSTEPSITSESRITFLSNRNGHFNVFTIDPYGEIIQITNSKTDIEFYEYSPNGAKIIYSNSSATSIIDNNGKNNFTLINEYSTNIKFLPSGEQIAYTIPNYNRPEETRLLPFIINIDGTENKPISINPTRDYEFSEDGSVIYLSEINMIDQFDYLIVQDNISGLRDTILTSEKHCNISNLKLFSDDTILFFELDYEYCTINIDGSNFKQHSNFKQQYNLYKTYNGLFCEETKKLIYYGAAPNQDGWHIYSSNLDGSDLKDLSPFGYSDISPFWAKNGKRIYFASTPTNNENRVYDIMSMNNDGSNRMKITDNLWIDWYPKIID